MKPVVQCPCFEVSLCMDSVAAAHRSCVGLVMKRAIRLSSFEEDVQLCASISSSFWLLYVILAVRRQEFASFVQMLPNCLRRRLSRSDASDSAAIPRNVSSRRVSKAPRLSPFSSTFNKSPLSRTAPWASLILNQPKDHVCHLSSCQHFSMQ